MRLLIVDDHAECRGMTVRLLTCLGHEVVEAEDAEGAAAVLRREGEHIDLVLLDLFLGESHGVAVAESLTAEHPHLRVLFMSGDGDANGILVELERPGRRFLEKPFTLPALEAALASLTTQH